MPEFYLKILSGNHIGAEIPLEPGRYSVGTDENCDLVLTDASLHDIELIIEISSEGALKVQTSTPDTPLYLNGIPSGSGVQSNHFDVLTSSGLFFALGPSDAQWPDLPLPELMRPEGEEEETIDDVPSDAGDSEQSEEDLISPDFEDELSDDYDESESEEDEEYEDEDDESESSLLERVNPKWLLAIPLGIASIFLLFLLIIPSPSVEPEPEIPGTIEQAEQSRKELKLKDIKFKQQPDQSLLITGYTTTTEEKSELHKRLRTRGIPFNSQIVAMSEMRFYAETLLKSMGYETLSLELDNTAGSLVLTGYVATSEELERIIVALKQEIHGLASVVDQVENQVGRVNTLKSMLREKGLSPRIQAIVRAETITLKGHLLDEGQVYDLQELVRRFRKRYANKPAVILSTKYAGAPIANENNQIVLPSLNIRGISMGNVPYVVLVDGSKYLIGAKLSNGYIIEDINLEYLLLTNGTDRIKYRLGGNRGGQTQK